MGMSREILERQLSAAQQRRDKQADKLGEQGLTEKQYRSDPDWRHWNAQCRSLTARLNRVSEKEALRAPSADESS